MTNTEQVSEIERVLALFDGGIHDKGSERGGYPTYFTEPYPLWVSKRKQIVVKLISDLITKARIDEWDFAGDVIEAANQYSLDKYIEMRDEHIAELSQTLKEHKED